MHPLRRLHRPLPDEPHAREIERAYEKNDAEALKALKVGLCIECGCCAFQCPAHRPLVQVNKLSKTLVRDYDNRMKTLKEAGK